jgi:hypothetical protein
VSRFCDNVDLVAPEDYMPTTVQTLLAHSRLEGASTSQQESGIRAWLENHSPGHAMEFTLRRRGFGHLLDRRSAQPAARLQGNKPSLS